MSLQAQLEQAKLKKGFITGQEREKRKTSEQGMAPTDPSETGDAGTAAPAAKKPNPWAKLAIEFGPLLVFFAVYRFSDLFVATGVFMVSMVLAIIASKRLEGKVAPMLWLTFTIVMVMGSLTLYFNDETFVKMKPTLINGLFASILFFGMATGRPFLKLVMAQAFPPMTDKGWAILNRNWAFFFTFMAVLNEVIWRSLSTDLWVTIKTFGYIPITFVFVISQTSVLMKHQIAKPGD